MSMHPDRKPLHYPPIRTPECAGRGRDPDGVSATKEGECPVLCPACPKPGKTLPANWRDAPQQLQ